MGPRDVLAARAEKHREVEDDDNNVGLDFGRIQRLSQESCRNRRMMVLPQHHQHQYPSPSSPSPWPLGGGGSGFDGARTCGGGGPMFGNQSNQALVASYMGDLYGLSGSVLMSKPLHTHNSADPLNSSGDMMADALNRKGVAFTAAQRQELERQTVIYKYMMASAAIPHELLASIAKNSPSHTDVMRGGGSWKIGSGSGNNNSSSDPEPWRCRRTDGKKWRCSRDVAPDQRYCERHSHKSRPRSRKPVESAPNFNSVNNHSLSKSSVDQGRSRSSKSFHHHNPNLATLKEHSFPIYSATPSTYDHQRGLKWLMKEETVVVPSAIASDHGMEFGERFRRDYECQNNQFDPPDTVCLNLNQTHIDETRHFIDAWSRSGRDATDIEAICNTCSVASEGKLPFSPLTLSMPGSSEWGHNEEQANEQMFMRAQWMSQGSWMGSPPGGPLAEALCLGVASSSKGASSSCTASSSTTNSSCSKSSS